MNDKKIFNILIQVNVYALSISFLCLLSTLFFEFEDSWAYLPVFPYSIPKNDLYTELTFYSTYFHEVNLGFYVQLIMIIFAFMVYFAKKNLISFQFAVLLSFLHSVLILMQADVDEFLASHIFNGQPFFKIFNWFYAIFFFVLLLLNYFYDIKKAPKKSGAFIQD